MQKAIFKLGLPDYITIETEEWKEILRGEDPTVRDVSVEIKEEGEGMAIAVTAETSRLRSLKLRWNTPLDKRSRILRSSWERTYGDARWRGISGRAFLPWYFLASCEGKVKGYGVKVRPSAMCFWQADTRGITLVLDTRCGGTGVELNGRKLVRRNRGGIKWAEASGSGNPLYGRRRLYRL